MNSKIKYELKVIKSHIKEEIRVKTYINYEQLLYIEDYEEIKDILNRFKLHIKVTNNSGGVYQINIHGDINDGKRFVIWYQLNS